MSPLIFHGLPLTPNAAFEAVMPGRSACVSFFRPEQAALAEEQCPHIMWDNGAYSEWQAALKRGEEWFVRDDWTPYYRWLEDRLFWPGRWAVIPDAPGAPSQLNDGLLNAWPFGQKGAPLWHMDGPIERLGRLCEKYDRVCLGWVGEFDPATGKIRKDQQAVGCDAYRERMDDVARLFGNRWPVIHMMRGIMVARDYPFASADSTSLAQNGCRYDSPIDEMLGDQWRGRRAYADRLESGRFRRKVPRDRVDHERASSSPRARSADQRSAEQLGLW